MYRLSRQTDGAKLARLSDPGHHKRSDSGGFGCRLRHSARASSSCTKNDKEGAPVESGLDIYFADWPYRRSCRSSIFRIHSRISSRLPGSS